MPRNGKIFSYRNENNPPIDFMSKHTRKSAPRRLELLAPAGSPESFHAAIESGADAVYCGLGDFNARARAKNFTAKTLSYLVPYAHSKKTKVYATFNTLLKQRELEPVLHAVFQLEQIGVDAVIVQDFGLAMLIRSNFPDLRIHASTQMSIHTSEGARAAARLGIQRVVLARELSLEEIELIAKRSPVELEVFCHGALCYSISGACLASSFLGGKSGNRGKCTQVCRRPFSDTDTSGHFFSTRDFSAIHHLGRIAGSGVCSVKIEGRLKSPDYIGTVVKAYRQAIDRGGLQSKDEWFGREDFGRDKTDFFLSGLSQDNAVIDPSSSATGIPLGKVVARTPDSIILDRTTVSVEPNDYVRVQPQTGYEGFSCRVQHVLRNETTLTLALESSSVSVGDTVYLARRTASTSTPVHVSVRPRKYREFFPSARQSIARASAKKAVLSGATRSAGEIYTKVNTIDWFAIPGFGSHSQTIAALNQQEMTSLIHPRGVDPRTIILALPPFISELELPGWKNLIAKARKKGFTRWMPANIGQCSLLHPRDEIITDTLIWCTNRVSQRTLQSLFNANRFCYSLEDDYPNMRACANKNGFVYLYGHVPVFISRIRPQVTLNESYSDTRGDRFFVAEHSGIYYTLSESRLCLFKRRTQLQAIGLTRHIIDLSFIAPHTGTLKKVLESYQKERTEPGSSLFNHKRGLH